MSYNNSEVVYLNTSGDTTHYLANSLEVEGFACGVIEVNGKINSSIKKTKELYLCSDICKGVFINGIKLPILRQIFRNSSGIIQSFNNKIWLQVMRPNISSIRLYITDENGNIISVGQNWLQCSLLFIAPTK